MPRDTRELAGAWTRFQRHSFRSPSPDLAPYVDHYWAASWDYDEPYRQLIVPYPNVHLIFQDGGAKVQGVRSGHQIRVLEGTNGVFGVTFRPGGFRPFLRASVSTITDRSVDAGQVFPGDLPDPPEVATVEDFLRARFPGADTGAERAMEAVATIAAAPEVTRVGTLARRLGSGVRELQRLFAEHVGIGPKWVIRRYRLHEVTERLARGTPIDWAGLAAELGYADQAHFVRDFKDMFGESPTWYAARY
ncbi:AraC-like DNA-binding protein [Streptosporangium becharense]|uniref:AraC-like DNA-binding protein n=1 Tax=Streptosporangium becharense TaxID=1816182 RepID=A0A7W9IC52_9ACTN|nr:helix-turn-helix domain-containing protein [Streptosporangium becharense]MBB2915173.1 AraC-like DNA-binding protein [Streptosporangium becharense]MBB5817998.1 AraC-like DNA-binding protein [Streptosporangium becharense]